MLPFDGAIILLRGTTQRNYPLQMIYQQAVATVLLTATTFQVPAATQDE